MAWRGSISMAANGCVVNRNISCHRQRMAAIWRLAANGIVIMA